MRFSTSTYIGISLFVVFIIMWFMSIYEWLSLPLIASFFLLMLAILESKQDRVMKGISLILFGIFFGIFLPESLISGKGASEALPPDLIDKIEIFKNLAIFSCSGAGGSIIAGHAERYLSDVEKAHSTLEEVATVDHSQQIKAVRNELMKLRRYFVYFSGILVMLLLALVVLIV